MRLINSISSILKTDKLDVVVMNKAPLLLNYNIIKEGRILQSRDEAERLLRQLEREGGDIYSPRPGRYKKTQPKRGLRCRKSGTRPHRKPKGRDKH